MKIIVYAYEMKWIGGGGREMMMHSAFLGQRRFEEMKDPNIYFAAAEESLVPYEDKPKRIKQTESATLLTSYLLISMSVLLLLSSAAPSETMDGVDVD